MKDLPEEEVQHGSHNNDVLRLRCIKSNVSRSSREVLSPSALPCPSDTTPGVLCLVLDSPVQEWQAYTRESPVKGYEDS